MDKVKYHEFGWHDFLLPVHTVQPTFRMKNLAEQVRKLISGNTNTPIQSKSHPFDCVKTRKGILRELMISKESGNLIGLFSPALGEGMFLIVVQCIESRSPAEEIAFHKFDVRDGRTLSTGRLSVNDIKAICPFINHKHAQY